MRHDKGEKFNPEKSPRTMCYILEHDTFDVRCNKCGCPVLKSDVDGYVYQCMNCDEDLYSVETHKGEHHTDEELNQLCLDTETLLELDSNSKADERLAALKQLQCAYAASIGGLLYLSEADDIWNDFNRKILETYSEVYPECQLGSFQKTVTEPYNGQLVYNFGCDFVIPKPDEALKNLIEKRLLAGYTDMASIMKIQTRIKNTGGIVFIWK